MSNEIEAVPSVSVAYAANGSATKANAFGMHPMRERIYIGRWFKNDTERLEKLSDLYTKVTAATASAKSATKPPRNGKA